MSNTGAIATMADLGREGILVHHAGNIEAGNRALARIFGYRSAELTGKPLSDLLTLPEIPADYDPNIPLEASGTRQDGSRVYLEVIPFEMESDRHALLCLDVTARKQAQAAISESEMLLSLIFNHTSDVMGLLELRNDTWHLVKMNGNVARYAKVFGENWSMDALIGLPLKQYLSDFFKLDQAAIKAYMQLIARAFETNEPVELVEETPYGNGQLIIEESTITPISDATGPRYVLLVSKEITKRTLAERALEESNRRYQQLMGNLPGAVFQCLFDTHWTLRFISAGIEQVTGHRAVDFLPPNNLISYDALIAPFDIDRVRNDVATAINSGEAYLVEYRITDSTGNERWVRERGSGVYENGEATMIEGFIFDITASVAAEQRVLSSILETETRERSRIAKELHDSLVQNLTSSALTMGTLAQSTEAIAPEHRERFEHGIALLKDAIHECREISHNLMPKSIEDFGLSVAISSTLEDLNAVADCHFELIENIGAMELDNKLALTLFRVVQEAVNNILKHAKATRATIQLLLFQQSLQLIIEDNGHGFDVEAAGKHSFGLNSIRSRARSLGAQLFVESNVKSGTSIHLEVEL